MVVVAFVVVVMGVVVGEIVVVSNRRKNHVLVSMTKASYLSLFKCL